MKFYFTACIRDSFWIVVFILSFPEVNVYDEHTCIAEIVKVASCPTTEDQQSSAARRKGCSFVKSNCSYLVNPLLVYHCLPNAWRNESFEMCAVVKEIIGFSCPEFNNGGRIIQPNYKTSCNNPEFDKKCPFKFLSSQAYLYTGCSLSQTSKTTVKSTGSEQKSSTTSTTVPSTENDKYKLPFFLASSSPFVILLIGSIVFLLIKFAKDKFKTNYIPNEIGEGTTVTEEELCMITSVNVQLHGIKD